MSSNSFLILEIPSLCEIGAYTTSVSLAILCRFSSLNPSRVSILCNLSLIFITSTRGSSTAEISILRKVSAATAIRWFAVFGPSSSLRISSIFVNASTNKATPSPNSFLTSSKSHFVSSTTSCNKEAQIIASSPP